MHVDTLCIAGPTEGRKFREDSAKRPYTTLALNQTTLLSLKNYLVPSALHWSFKLRQANLLPTLDT